jgi:hypothetical protein
MYVKRVGKYVILFVIYVDDIIIIESEESAINQIRSNMSKIFDITGLGLHYCLGVEVWKTSKIFFVSQTKYARSLLDMLRMTNCKIPSTLMEKGMKLSTNTNSKEINESIYRQVVGILIYLTTTTLDLSFVVGFISILMTTPKVECWTGVKQVLRYVKETLEFDILYNKRKYPRLCWYTYLNWEGSLDDIKSTSGYVFSLGTGAITWTNNKQHAISLSSTEVEYLGTMKGAREAVWLRRMLSDTHMQQTKPTPLLCDNQGVIKISNNLVFDECTKHVEVHCHFIRQLVEDGSIKLQIVPHRTKL